MVLWHNTIKIYNHKHESKILEIIIENQKENKKEKIMNNQALPFQKLYVKKTVK